MPLGSHSARSLRLSFSALEISQSGPMSPASRPVSGSLLVTETMRALENLTFFFLSKFIDRLKGTILRQAGDRTGLQVMMQPQSGGCASRMTVTVKLPMPVLPELSTAVQVTVVTPSGKAFPD